VRLTKNWFSTYPTAFKNFDGSGLFLVGDSLLSCDRYYPASQLWSSVTSQPCLRMRYHCYYNNNTFGIGENGAGVANVLWEKEVPLDKFPNTQGKILVAKRFNPANS
jgi:hypothetical protein